MKINPCLQLVSLYLQGQPRRHLHDCEGNACNLDYGHERVQTQPIAHVGALMAFAFSPPSEPDICNLSSGQVPGLHDRIFDLHLNM